LFKNNSLVAFVIYQEKRLFFSQFWTIGIRIDIKND